MGLLFNDLFSDSVKKNTSQKVIFEQCHKVSEKNSLIKSRLYQKCLLVRRDCKTI